MPPHNVAALVHLVGFLTGAALYGMLFALVLRRRVGADDRLPVVTAILGLLWNVSGLAAFGIRDFAGVDPPAFLIATAYSALGFLPAVVVHSVLRSQSEARHRRAAAAFIWASYAMSTAAETLMFWSAFHGGPVPSATALQLLTWFYLGLTIPVFLLTRHRIGSARGWSIVALAVFAVSALHLSHREGTTESWFVELAGHHASIPLIFAILYQDFRFALADLFLKRALALFALVAIASGLYVGVEVPLFERHDFRGDPVAVGVSVILWVGLALLYPPLCRAATWIVDRVVLHRVDYKRLRADFDRRLTSLEEPSEVMNLLVDVLRAPLAAEKMRWIEDGAHSDDPVMRTIPTTEAPRYALVVGELAGGRRLLSDDLEMLDGVALTAARRIDAIRLDRERYQQNRLATEAELRALRAQMNPHFLFNALNTIGYLIQTSPARAQSTLMKLTALLRGVLRSADANTTLGEEIDLVCAYLEIESARFEERLHVDIDVPSELRRIRVPALMIQPLVENAIKHGIANCRSGGRVAIESRTDGDNLAITVTNSGARVTDAEIARGRKHGVGLANLDARLRHQYGDAASLTLVASAGETRAEIVLPMGRRT
ncbi:MAG TPA: histidine kinase [Thermoanaerobaculia bacterium]|jgi:two-component system LytT family sensor kinase|nr:histidine kinase [Thermoanaerobaculia bacterium]